MMTESDSSSFVVASKIDSFYPSFQSLSGEPGQGTADTNDRQSDLQLRK